MADRGPVIPPTRRPEGGPPTIRLRTVGPYTPPPPIIQTPVPPASEPSGSSSRRLGSRPADRTLTINGANAAAPIVVGNEPLPVGGHIIYAKRFGARLVIDFLITLGQVAEDAFDNFKFGDKTAAAVGATLEYHYGADGDNSSALIAGLAGSYTTRNRCARITARFDWPNQDSGDYNPLDFTCTSKGILCRNLITDVVEATGNPVMIAHELLENPIYRLNPYDPLFDFMDEEWRAGQGYCDEEIADGIKRWVIAGKIDQQATSESWIRQILDHCNGHLRPNGGRLGLWLDRPRDPALDGDGNPIVFIDYGPTANLYQRASVVHKGADETCTVATVDYTDGENGYIDGNTQDPKPADVDPTVEYIEERFSRSLTTRTQQANRQAKYLKKLKEISVDDFTLPAWQVGVQPLEGDRVFVKARRLIPGDQTVPNAGAEPGVEDVVIVGQTLSKLGVMLRARPYRDALFDDTLDTTGGPNPPGDDGLSDPEPPTDLVLENVVTWASGVATVQIKVTWTPAAEPYTTYTRIMFSRNAGVDFEELGNGFQVGPAFLPNPTLGVLHVFRLYTVRTSTGQTSIAAEEDIVPGFTDDTIPEVTQLRLRTNNKMEWYGPIRGGAYLWTPPPAPALAEVPGSFDTPAGTHEFASSEVTAWGENVMGERASITISAGSRIDVSSIDPSPPALVRMKKLYKTLVDDPGGDLFHISEMAVVGSSDSWIHDDSSLVDNELAPVVLDGIAGWEVFDAFGVADPTTDPMPLFVYRLENNPAHKYAALDCTPIVHSEGGGFVIKAYVRVVMKDGGTSVGRYIEQLSASPGSAGGGDSPGPGNVVFNQNGDTQVDSGFLVSEIGGVGLPAVGLWSLYQSDGTTFPLADGQNDNCRLKTIAGLYNAGGSGSGLPFSISGFKLETEAGVGPPLFHVEIEIVNVDETGAIMSIKHATGSDTLCQVHCPDEVDYVVGGLWSTVTLRYNALVGSWFVMSPSPVRPTDYIGNSITDQDRWMTITHTAKARMFAVGFPDSFSLAGGATYDDLTPPETGMTTVTGSAGTVTITGMVNPNTAVGSRIELEDQSGTGRSYVFKHEDVGSAAANRFSLPGGADITISGDLCRIAFEYDLSAGRWKFRFKNV